MIVSVIDARYVDDYRIWLRFNTGEEGVADLADLIDRYPAAGPLRDRVAFAGFHLDEWPTLVWPCGFDISPEALYERAIGKSAEHVAEHIGSGPS